MADGCIKLEQRRKKMKRILILAVFVISMFAASSVSAQESKAIFRGAAKNTSGVKFSDWDLVLIRNKPLIVKQLINVMQAHTFHFKAGKGQQISIKVVSKEPTTAFVVYTDNEDLKEIGTSSKNKTWQGEIEADGDYKIVLSADAKSNYTITVELN